MIDTHANDTVPTLSFNGTLCACGKLADETWVRFKIGPIYEYRRDPHNAFAALSLQRAESSVLMQVDDGERSAGSSATSLVLGASASASSVELGDDMQGKTRYRPSGLRMEKLPQGPDEEGFARARMDVDPFDGRPRTVSTNS